MRLRKFPPALPIALAALLVGACGRPPLVPGQPKGPAQWLRDVATACTTSTTDPSGAQVSYQFDWGDGAKSEWSQPMDGGVPFADTHSYTELGPADIMVRAKNSKKASGWSEPLSINVTPGEGNIAWSIGFPDPDSQGEDSADFSLNSFAIGPDNTAYIGCVDYGAVIARGAWKFYTPDLDEFTAAPVVADDGTIFIGCSNDTFYALNSNGTVKWRAYAAAPVNATAALGADGTVYFQTEDSMVAAINPGGSQIGSFPTGGGNSAPVIGVDGTVYAANQDGTVYALAPDLSGTKWTYNLGSAVVAPPAIDPSRNALYVANDLGLLQSLDLANGTGNWSYNAGDDASGPVVGTNGSVYIGGGGKLSKLNPDDGAVVWTFIPPMAGVVSTPAVTADGYLYILAVAGKKKLALQATDSLYAVNADGTKRWACGLGEGYSDPDYPLSAPKVDANGLIYVGDGFRAWCVVGISAPAASAWPMLQHDAANSGRAR